MENLKAVHCIALNELKQLIIIGKEHIKIIDVRSREEYEQRHIPGAINIPTSQLELACSLFDKTDLIVTACGKGGGRSAQAAGKLRELGFEYSDWLSGGTFGWYED